MAYQYDASSRPLQRSENAIYEIEQNWQFMTEEEFNPVPLALQLMDSSSVGRSYSEFMRYFHALDDSLKDIVEEYYQGFNNSILSFGEIKDKITETQQTLRLVQGRVKQTSEMLSQDKSSLAQLYYKCSQHNEMIRILDRIEELKQISTDIEDLNSRKQYLASVQKLLAGLETVNSDTMRSIGALSDLSAQLNKEKGTVFEVLIEELHNHVYLKSPYCERKLGIVDADDDVDQNDDLSRSARATHSTATGEHTSQSKKSPWHRREGRDDATGPDTDNPEADSYSYVEMLIKSLVLLERIDDTVTAIQERIPIELYNLANRVIAEVEERHKVALESTLETHEVSHASFPQSRMTVEQRSQAQDILEDFVTTLYARFGSVLEYHKFALEVIDRESRRGSDQRASALAARGLTSSYALREVWMAIQSEIKSLLYDYLTADVVVARESDLDLRSGTTAPSSVSSLLDSFKFRDKRGRLGAFDRNHGRQWLEDLHIIRGKGSGSNGTASHSPLLGRSGRAFVKDSKQIFSFSQSEIKDTTEALYKPVGDEMHQALGSLSHPSINHISPANPTAIDRFADSNSSAGHRLLVPPSIYHASVVLTPTTQFLAKVGHVLLDPRDTQEFDEFLRHFFVRFFLPQVEAHAMQLFQQLT
ncbi:exocyst subunit, partial [Dispira simplex]